MSDLQVEYGVFRKGGDWHDAPMEGFTFQTRARAERFMGKFRDWDEWLEVRMRQVTKWELEI